MNPCSGERGYPGNVIIELDLISIHGNLPKIYKNENIVLWVDFLKQSCNGHVLNEKILGIAKKFNHVLLLAHEIYYAYVNINLIIILEEHTWYKIFNVAHPAASNKYFQSNDTHPISYRGCKYASLQQEQIMDHTTRSNNIKNPIETDSVK